VLVDWSCLVAIGRKCEILTEPVRDFPVDGCPIGIVDDFVVARKHYGSTRLHKPPSDFGEVSSEEQQTTASNTEKFATYYRDQTTNFDYANQRYYSSVLGRFLTPDPYRASGGSANPQSWNRYAYVLGDPVNFRDPDGADPCPADDPCLPDDEDGGLNDGDHSPSRGPRLLPQVRPEGSEGAPSMDALVSAMFSALEALKDPKCSGIFNTDPEKQHKYNPRDVLASIIFGGNGPYFGMLKSANLSLAFAAVTEPDPKTSVRTGMGVVAASADIVLQGSRLSDSYYPAQTSHDLALTLIHELGHVFNIVDGLGGSKVLYDVNADGTPNRKAQDKNGKTLENCNPK
jgi:RHS repeat-associated protein